MSFAGQKPKSNDEHNKSMTIYCPHDDNENRINVEENFIQCVSIDPGSVNFCIRIERRYSDGKIYHLFSENIQIKDIVIPEKQDYVYCSTYFNLFKFLDSSPLSEFISESHYVIIERQLAFNHTAVAVMTSLMSYFTLKLRNNLCHSMIYVISPKLKNKVLFPNVKSSVTKKELKRMSIERASILLLLRGDGNNLTTLYHSKKMDDLADVICQSEAFCKSRDHNNITAENITTKKNDKSLDISFLTNIICSDSKLFKSEKIKEIYNNVKSIFDNEK